MSDRIIRRPNKKLIGWIVLPITISLLLLATNSYLSVSVDAWIRYLVIFLLALPLYVGTSMYRGNKFSKQMLAMEAVLALFYAIGLVWAVTSLITGNRPLIEGWDLHLDVLSCYLLILVLISAFAAVATRKK